jgi:type VI secretion system secreted protein Hcp
MLKGGHEMSQAEANEIVRETQRLRRTRRVLKIGLPTAAALGAGAAIAVAAIPAGDGTITGCYASPNPSTNSDGIPNNITVNGVTEPPGTLRVIDPSLPHTLPVRGASLPNPAAVCEQEETQITWNQSGPQGPTGPQGPAGPAGSPGANGGQGAAGGQGAQGAPLIGSTGFGLGNSAGETFLKIDGIDGESTDKQHAGDIELDSFALSAQGNIGSSSSGAGAGKSSIQTFSITKTIDKSSPLLLQAAGEGKVFKEAELLFARKAGGKQQNFLKIDFTNVLISSFADGSTNNKPTEQVTFTFQKVQETYIEPNGKSGPTISFNTGVNLKI